MTILYLNSDKMGNGDEKLGKKLLKIYLNKLADSEVQIDAIGCVNSGIFLTTEGSQVLDSLFKLQEKGTKISTCGTCLEYHGIKEKLLIGEIGTMDQTVQILAKADRVISL